MLLRYTGLRASEALALSIEDINFTTKELTVSNALKKCFNNNGKTKTIYTKGTTKTGNTRYVPLRDDLLEQLEKYITVTNKNEKLQDWRKDLDNRLFINPHSGHENVNKIRHQIKNVLESNNCKIKYGNHKYRHTYATYLVSKELEVNIVKELLGHTDIKTTLSYYVGITAEMKQKSRDIINTL